MIDLTPKYEPDDCFSCWIDTISSIIMFGFNLVQDVTAFASSSLKIAILTFDGQTVNTYYNLNDPAINDYPQLSQVLSLIQSLQPVVAVDYISAPWPLSDATSAYREDVIPLRASDATFQSFLFSDVDELFVLNENSSYREVCDESGVDVESYLIHSYQALESNLFPLYSIQCAEESSMDIEDMSIFVINGSTDNYMVNERTLRQLYITTMHEYCPQQCHECDLPLYDESREIESSVFLKKWEINRPMTSGWSITTSAYSYQQIIKSVDVSIYELSEDQQIQVSLYDYAADDYVSQSVKYNGMKDEQQYSIELPLQNDEGEYNYLLPNHQYAINIRLFNIKIGDNVQIALQNNSNLYYSPQSYDYFTSINGLLFAHSTLFPFDVENNALSQYTPFGSLCIICSMYPYLCIFLQVDESCG